MKNSFSSASRGLVVAAAIVIIIAGMKQAAPLLVPFLLSVFIAVLSLPALNALEKRGLGQGMSLLLVMLAVLVIGALLAMLVGSSIDDFSAAMPEYQLRISAQKTQFIDWLTSLGITVPSVLNSSNFDPNAAMRLAASIFAGFGKVLTNSFLILLTVIFILLEVDNFSSKVAAMSGKESRLSRDFVDKLNRYMSIKTWMSAATGILVTTWLWVLGVDNAELWGVLAFMFNFVPNIGSIIAAVPAVLLALVQLGVGSALLVMGGYVAINIVIGSILEPRYMGRGLGLSTLVVFLSLIFWGWVLGPVGMLLSVPLTIALKLALDSKPETRWLAILLGNTRT